MKHKHSRWISSPYKKSDYLDIMSILLAQGQLTKEEPRLFLFTFDFFLSTAQHKYYARLF